MIPAGAQPASPTMLVGWVREAAGAGRTCAEQTVAGAAA
jgi:hypothetical protein